MNRRVVITGMGVVTPIGNDLETFWDNLRKGVSGIGRIQAFDTSGYDCQIAGEVRNFEPKNYFRNAKDVRRTDRYTHLAMAAAKMAMEDSGLDLEKTDRRRFGADTLDWPSSLLDALDGDADVGAVDLGSPPPPGEGIAAPRRRTRVIGKRSSIPPSNTARLKSAVSDRRPLHASVTNRS